MRIHAAKIHAARVCGATAVLFAVATAAAIPASADVYEMPDVEGAVLQDAWDAVVSATDGTLEPQTSTAEGPPFEQINLTNWEVCSQSPADGEEVSADSPPELEVARPGAC